MYATGYPALEGIGERRPESVLFTNKPRTVSLSGWIFCGHVTCWSKGTVLGKLKVSLRELNDYAIG